MTKEFNLNSFFQSNKGLTTIFSVTPIADGTDGKGKGAVHSQHRTSSANDEPKISKIAFGAERLMQSSVLQSEDSVYIEYNSEKDGARVGIYFDGNTLSSNADVSKVGVATAIVAYLAREASDLEETRELFSQMIEDKVMNGNIQDYLYFSLCDSTYFGWQKSKKSITINDELNFIELQMAVNNKKFARFFDRSDDFELITYVEEKPSETTTTLPVKYEEMWEEIKRGEWALPYDWDAESMSYIPQLEALTKYHPTEKFFEVALQLRNSLLGAVEKEECGVTLRQELMSDCINAVLTGEPGTGKTILLYSLASALQIPCYTIALDAKTESDEFKGMVKVDGETGKLHFEFTDFLRGFTKGGLVILEEVNLLDPNLAQGVLGQALEYPYVIFKDGNQKVERHHLCAIYSTMNTGTTGSMSLNQAFASRSPSVYVLDSVTKDDFIRALVAKFGNRFTTKQGEWVYKVWETAQAYLKQDTVQAEDIALAVSQRSCYELLKQVELTGNAKSAIRNTIFGTVFLYDPQIAHQLIGAIDVAVGEFPAA